MRNSFFPIALVITVDRGVMTFPAVHNMNVAEWQEGADTSRGMVAIAGRLVKPRFEGEHARDLIARPSIAAWPQAQSCDANMSHQS